MIKDLFRKSLPAKSNIHGIEIKKLPLGAYLDAIDSLKTLPDILLKNAFPGLGPDEVLERFKTINTDTLMELAGNLLVTVPEQALRFIAALIGVEYERLRSDPEIGLNGIMDILTEFWKVNDMQSFFDKAGRALLSSKILKQIQSGSKN